jgi:hypothetical protein
MSSPPSEHDGEGATVIIFASPHADIACIIAIAVSEK